jgi:hypothetical protein
MLENLKRRWGLGSTFRVIMILIVFTCTGFSVLYVEDFIFGLMGVPDNRGWLVRGLLFIFITLPVYNILLLIFGFIFGQFRFFWEFEKRFFGRIGKLFVKKK